MQRHVFKNSSLNVVPVVLQSIVREKQAVLRHAVKQTMSMEGSYKGVARDMADLKAKLMGDRACFATLFCC